jgi:uncharacterized integral membrane protein
MRTHQRATCQNDDEEQLLTDTKMPADMPVPVTDTPAGEASPVEHQPMPNPADPAGSRDPSRDPRERTRISGTWVGILIAAVVLVLLLVFILQNMKSVKVSYFAANGHIPLGVVLTLACAAGVLLSGVVASLRILQIRRSLANMASQPAPAVAPGPLPGRDPGENTEPAGTVVDPAAPIA